MTLQFEEVLSDRFRKVFSYSDGPGFMGVYGDFMDLSPNEWLMFKLAGLRATQFRYKPIFSFSKAVGIFEWGSTRSLIEYWIVQRPLIPWDTYIYIYSLDLCVGGVWLPSFVYIQGGAIPWDIHWICVLLAMLGPHRIFTGGITEQFPISSWTIPVGSSKWSIFSAG